MVQVQPAMPYHVQQQQIEEVDFTDDDVILLPAPHYEQQPTSKHDHYVEQKAEEIAQSEEVDMTAEIHGEWTMDNCKQALNEFCQKNHLPAREYKITEIGSDNSSTIVAENQIFLPQMKRTIFGHGQGSNQKVAKTSCALSLVRQLFHMGSLPPAAGVKAARGKKTSADDLPEIKVNVEPNLVARIDRYLANSGVHPVEEGLEAASPDNPRSLLIDQKQKLEDFPPGQRIPLNSSIMWAPPCQNWNAWHSTNIDNKPIAFWSLERISQNLMEQEKIKKIPERMARTKRLLPVYNYRDQILRKVADNPVVLIKGSTGCGKSTQICQYLLESHVLASRGSKFNCYVTQPRRISAITLAERVTMERQEQLGESIGYSVRFETATPRPYGAVMFVTVGVLMRKMEMGLRGISHVIIDEIHERDINTDFLLTVIRDMVRANPKLRVLLMSATIDTNLFTEYFGKCPIIEIKQQMFPVQSFFLEDLIQRLNYMPGPREPEKKNKKKRKKNNTVAEKIEEGAGDEEEGGENSMELDENMMICDEKYPQDVKQALSRMSEKEIPIELIEILLIDIDTKGTKGAVLIFLPGWNIISMMLNRLMLHPIFSNPRLYIILPLHSQLSSREQHRVFEPVGENQRKIILSTNIAETSVTIDDVVYVIDSCRVREKMYTSRNNLVHFANVWASQTNLQQRRGRAGRVQQGFCFHLVTQARYNALEEHRAPEMLRTPLHEITLTIKLLRLGSVGGFLEKAVQPPPMDAVVEAEVLLREMNALDKNLELTDLGRILARLPIDPKLGKMVLLGASLGVGDLMLTAAAATSFNSPYVPVDRMQTKLSHMHRSFSGNRPSDHIGLVNANYQFNQERQVDEFSAENFCRRYSLSYPLLNMTQAAKLQLYNVLTKNSGFPKVSFMQYPIDVHGTDPKLDVFLSLLIAAYYPNICYQNDHRRVFTLKHSTALLGNMSVCVPLRRGERLEFASPLFMFTEKVKNSSENYQIPRNIIDNFGALSLQFQLRTSCISCKQVSMISPLQLLLFGCRRIDAIGTNRVRLDKMIPLNMPASVAAKIVSLRPCLEGLLIRSCVHPEYLAELSKDDFELCRIVREISSEYGWLPTGEEGLEPINQDQPNTSQGTHRYNVSDQGNYAMPQRPNFSSISPSRKRAHPPAPVISPYGFHPKPFVPVQAGQDAVAAANNLAMAGMTAAAEYVRENVPFEQRDFSSLAGYWYGPSNYYGSDKPNAMMPQQRHLQQNGSRFIRGSYPRSNGKTRRRRY